MPILPSFFKTRKPKQFEYMPRHYDEKKEKMADRYKRIALELNMESVLPKEENNTFDIHRAQALRHRLKSDWSRNKPRQGGGSAIRFITILAGLLLIAYWLLFK